MMKSALLAAVVALFVMTPARASDVCPERPGQTTPPCIVDRGRLMVETGLVDWSVNKDDNGRTDTLTFASTDFRLGLDAQTEIFTILTPYQHTRSRDDVGGTTDIAQGFGDTTIGIKRNFGPSSPIAVQAYVVLPTGASAVSAGDWSVGMRLPVAFDLTDAVSIGLTPEIDAAVDGDGHGRHLAYGAAAGIGFALNDKAQFGVDLRATRDDDPAGATTPVTLGASFALQSGDNTQFDIGSVAGLNHDAPGLELYVGIARRF